MREKGRETDDPFGHLRKWGCSRTYICMTTCEGSCVSDAGFADGAKKGVKPKVYVRFVTTGPVNPNEGMLFCYDEDSESEKCLVFQKGIQMLYVEVAESSPEVATICAELQAVQRQRAWFMKTKIMNSNRIESNVAGTIGYYSGMEGDERKRVFNDARKLIKEVAAGKMASDNASMILTMQECVDSVYKMEELLKKKLGEIAKKLPVAAWAMHKDQSGFGLQSLGTVIGETGDLANYANPAKMWRRMGLAPYEKDGEMLMGATWKSRSNNKKGLTKLGPEDWEDFGYCPRRRSISWNIGECLIKQNGDGPYRQRWLDAKVRAYEMHPEKTDSWNWSICDKCKGVELPCKTCGGTGYKCGHANNHGKLLATKLLFKNLWFEWQRRSGGAIHEADK
jgi:hypothetical protein